MTVSDGDVFPLLPKYPSPILSTASWIPLQVPLISTVMCFTTLLLVSLRPLLLDLESLAWTRTADVSGQGFMKKARSEEIAGYFLAFSDERLDE